MTDKEILSALHEEPISPCEECAAISIDCKNLCAQYKKWYAEKFPQLSLDFKD